VFVKVDVLADRWARTGWCFESLGSERVLERLPPAKREVGQYFYRVMRESGVQLYQRAELKSPLTKDTLPKGRVIEAGLKVTPVGSPVTFVAVDDGGFIIERDRGDSKVVKDLLGEPMLEEIDCPEGVLIPQPQPNPTLPSVAAVKATQTAGGGGGSTGMPVSTGNHMSNKTCHRKTKNIGDVDDNAFPRMYRVSTNIGARLLQTPDLTSPPAPAGELLKEGGAFSGVAEVVKHYEGLGEVTFVQRGKAGPWVRMNRGRHTLVQFVSNRREEGCFMYKVVHENGVVVRVAPGLDARLVKPKTILPVRRVITVSERLVLAEDLVAARPRCLPPIFLRLEGGLGWVFDKREGTKVCEDITARVSRSAATATTTTATSSVSAGG
ncbi:unnamed protein product, partial [Discosporangium mesarthrocarpum]